MYTSKNIALGILKAIGALTLVCFLLFLLYKIQIVLIYIIISLVLALICNPMVTFLNKKLKFSNLWATIFTLGIMLLLMFGFIVMFIPLIVSQGQNLSLLNTVDIQEKFTILYQKLNLYLLTNNIELDKVMSELDINSKLDFAVLPSFLNSILNAISSFSMGFASVLFITFFFLKDKASFVLSVTKILPTKQETRILASIDKIKALLSRYFIGLLLQLLIVFILYYIVLSIFDSENAFVIAFLCAVLNIVPYIGPIIGSVLAATMTMISNIGSDFQSEILPTTIYVFIGFMIVQIIDNNINQPLIFSNSVKSHPLEIFLVVLIAGFLSGIIGMVIAIPTYTIIKVIAKEFFSEYKLVKEITKNI